MGSLECNLGNL
jgi:tetratricopeptide (TPR) repeat protein